MPCPNTAGPGRVLSLQRQAGVELGQALGEEFDVREDFIGEVAAHLLHVIVASAVYRQQERDDALGLGAHVVQLGSGVADVGNA